MNSLIESLSGKLIVSCQALPDEPLYGSVYMTAMARAAAMGGAAGIRANGADDIAAIHAAVALPILGIHKRRGTGFDVYITPDYADARLVVEAGAQIVALDGSALPRPGGEALPDIIGRIHSDLHVPVMADCSCLEDALYAEAAGADIIATTLAGYTKHGRPAQPGPDFDLISELVQRIQKPVIAEGRIHEPREVAEAFERGAFAVVVGTAITRPSEITRRFVAALPR
ncbi:MAG: N-acetylmannosamine-6-phosphate 2-epimerase [Chloroflexota bacterium]